MRAENAGRESLPEIWKAIKSEFPYTKINEADFLEKNGSGKTALYSIGKKELQGFAEFELVSGESARLNVVFVKKKFRRKGNGLALLEHAKKELKKTGFRRIILVVEKGNSAAKGLYSKAGFGFRENFPHKINGKKAEKWEIGFPRLTKMAEKK
ncbi:MAG: GNAT family N-acetyltransferase [archaeon]